MGLPGQLSASAQEPSQQPTTLLGTVLDPTGAKVPRARIALTPTDPTQPKPKPTLSDATGRFQLRLPPGHYLLTIASPGFANLTETLDLQPGADLHLTVSLRLAPVHQQITVPVDAAASLAGDDNRTALTFNASDLATFSDDQATFQKELLALAGAAGPRTANIYVDGFSTTAIPPKSTIRSIRLNRNPYSALYQEVGNARIEIDTRPGGDHLHGELHASGNARGLNAQNPYTAQQPPYYVLDTGGNLSGPLGRRSTFLLYADRNLQQFNSVINAVTLDASLNPLTLSQAVPSPVTTTEYTARADRQLSATHSLAARFNDFRVTQSNAGLDPLALVTQGYTATTASDTLQLNDSLTLGANIANDARLGYTRTRSHQTPNTSAPTLLVEGAFSGGGAPTQSTDEHQDYFEFGELFSITRGPHYLRSGATYRLRRLSNRSTANYNGQYTFPSLTAYQLTQQGLAAGHTPAQIRAAGGGASLFTLTAGQASASILSGNLAAFTEDEWRVSPRLTLDLGLRIESQSAIPDHLDILPRLGAAWAVHLPHHKSELLTLRPGIGLFDDRFSPSDLLLAIRQNGVSQQTYSVANPDFFSNGPAPSPASLTASPTTIYRISPTLRAEYGWIGGVSASHAFGRFATASVNYQFIRGTHQWDARNINAPLPGTWNPANPAAAVRPLGGSQNIFQLESEGIQKSQTVFFNSRFFPHKGVFLFATLVLDKNHGDTAGVTSFASNPFNLSADYGAYSGQRAAVLFTGGTFTLPLGLSADLYATVQSGAPLNITTGTDLNGDTLYNDRPAFATDLTRASVLRTRYGNFDTQPLPTQTLIPFNYAHTPGYGFLQLALHRGFALGPRQHPTPALTTRPWQLDLSVEAANLLNTNNPGPPVGVLSSPLFGQPLTLANPFGSNPAANRTLTLRSSFSF